MAIAQRASNGFTDLSNTKFPTEKQLYLNGEWEFYWNKLLSPGEFNNDHKPGLIYVPGAWNRDDQYPVLGCATYRLVVKLPEHRPSLSIYFPIFNSSAKVWINGILEGEVGKVSDHANDFVAELRGTIVPIPEKGNEIEIVVQVANFSYFGAGLPRTPQLDTPAAHFARTSRINGIENFFAGSLVAMFIYQLILYFLYHRGKPYLWLALICLGVALRAMIVHGGSFLLPNLCPFVPWEVWKKIEFGSVYGIVAIFPLYVYHLFINQAPRWPIYFFVSLGILLGIAVIGTPQYVYGRLLEVSHIGLLLGFIYAVYSISRAWRAGNPDARIILTGVLVSFPFILMEILKNSLFLPMNIPLSYLVEIGVLVFLLFQVYLLANHYALSYKKLETLNRDLEQIVELRTGELSTANKVKDRLLSVMSHDVKTPLNSLRGLLQIYNSGAINKEEFDHFSQHIEDDLSKTSILVENILYWTASQLKGVEVRKEVFAVNMVAREILQLFKTIAAHKRIALNFYSLSGDIQILSDKNILYLVLRNLVSNAIKFSHPDSGIRIVTSVYEHTVKIEVVDQGIGMDKNVIQALTGSEPSVSTLGTSNEKGTGLGLALCSEYLEKVGGRLLITSEKGKGSTFSIEIVMTEKVFSLSE
jgi:signal transduction histidine kinase